MRTKGIHSILIFLFLSSPAYGQDVAYNNVKLSYIEAHNLAYNGNHGKAQVMALDLLKENPEDSKARTLVARTYSWSGQYEKARREFNILTSETKDNREVWILAIKNELYAKNNATALGLANKALTYSKNDTELVRLAEMAKDRIINQEYAQKSWIDNTGEAPTKQNSKSSKNNKEGILDEKNSAATETKKEEAETMDKKSEETKKVPNNRVAIRNSFTVFDQRYEPMVFSTIEFRRRTLAGSLLPRINYSNRNGEHGLQYDIDFYPKFSKRFYAYLNYGYSDASIYPNHKLGGDLYVNLPGAMEFSAGGRYVSLDTRDITMITNSIGHYRGNYYFSLRSNIIPKDDSLIQFSGNLLVRKYLKDADNFLSFNIGMGYSPELRQLISGDELLAETLLYIESQRMSLQYQFTGKQNPNIYSASVGVSRQELAFQSGSFVWAVSAGLAYQVQF
jgi:YaiO family outer membrane protein